MTNVRNFSVVVFFLAILASTDAQAQTQPPATAGMVCRAGFPQTSSKQQLEELLPILCEGQMAALGKDYNLDFKSQELLQGALTRKLKSTPECTKNEEPCLVDACKELGARWCIYLTVRSNTLFSPTKPGYWIEITSVGLPDSHTLFIETGTGTTNSQDVTELINKTSTMTRELLKRISDLEAQPVLELAITPSDAQIEVNGSRLQPGDRHVRLNKPGTYTVRASKDGFLTKEVEVVCEPYGKYTVTIDLKPKVVEKPEILPPVVFQPNPARTPLIIGGWSSTAAGAILVGVGGYFLANAYSLDSEVANACIVTPCTISRPDAQAKQSDSTASYETGLALSITGGVLVVGGVVAAIIGHTFPSEAPQLDGTLNVPVTFHITPFLTPSQTGVILDARF